MCGIAPGGATNATRGPASAPPDEEPREAAPPSRSIGRVDGARVEVGHDRCEDRLEACRQGVRELELLPLGSADVEILTDLLTRHRDETDSAVAAKMLENLDDTIARFTKVLPRDYAAVLQTRQTAIDEGLDPDGDVTWARIMEVTGG